MSLANILDWMPHGLVSSVILIAVALLLRQLIVRLIRTKQEMEESDRRRWITTTRNVVLVFILAGLVFIWLPQLSTFALSITAFAVGVVIATKELILCLSGLVMRISTQPFEVGDWVEINGLRGEVIDEGMLAFRLQELDSSGRTNEFTGRTLSIPNSHLVLSHVTNEQFRRRYVFHHFRFVFEKAVDPTEPLALAKDVVADEIKSFAEVAARYWARVRKASGVDIPSADPKIGVRTTDIGKTVIEVTVFCPSKEAERIEQAVMQRLAAWAPPASAATTNGMANDE
ncbi:MAG: mechanosensitive ion channel family protein [Alphaproteobacteria bacterium]|nr:mechanosensitive ion channel family protein [Alphaproteobacteria bacterium]